MDIPYFRIELEGFKANVMHALARHNEDLAKLIQQRLDESMSQEWVLAEIDTAVTKAIRNAIENMCNNRDVARALEDIMAKTVVEAIQKK